MSMSDKIAVLNGGTVEQYASPENIYSSPETQFVSGKGSRFTELKLRTPAKILGWAYIAVVLLLSVGIPYFSVISTSLIDLRGYGFRPGNFTFQHYIDLFTENEKGIRALGNSLILAVSAATICAVLGTLIVIAVRKSRSKLGKVVEVVGLLPEMLTGIILVIGIMLFWNRIYNVIPLYNTLGIMILAYVVLLLPYTIQYVTSSFTQISGSPGIRWRPGVYLPARDIAARHERRVCRVDHDVHNRIPRAGYVKPYRAP